MMKLKKTISLKKEKEINQATRTNLINLGYDLKFATH